MDTNNATDGITAFNLQQAIFNENYTFSFYESIADANSDNPIPNPVGYINTVPFNQTVPYKIVDINVVSEIPLTKSGKRRFIINKK